MDLVVLNSLVCFLGIILINHSKIHAHANAAATAIQIRVEPETSFDRLIRVSLHIKRSAGYLKTQIGIRVRKRIQIGIEIHI